MKYLNSLFLLLCTTACTGTETLAIKSIYGNSQCGDTLASMRFIKPTQLPELMGQFRLQQTWGEQPAKPSDMGDWPLVLISLGQKPSGGYGVALGGTTAEVNGGMVALPLTVQEPAPDSLHTQQLTQPCLVVAIQPGNYQGARSAALPGLVARVAE